MFVQKTTSHASEETRPKQLKRKKLDLLVRNLQKVKPELSFCVKKQKELSLLMISFHFQKKNRRLKTMLIFSKKWKMV